MRLRELVKRAPWNRSSPKRQTGKKRARVSLFALAVHPSFVPLLTIWAAILCGGAILVLPEATTTRFAGSIGLSALGGFAKPLFAVVAASLGAAASWALAKTLRNRLSGNRADEYQDFADTPVPNRMINPALDLGSDSLDAPIEEEPFGFQDEGEDEIDLCDLLRGADGEPPESTREPSRKNVALSNGVSTDETAREDNILLSKPAKTDNPAAPTEIREKPRQLDLAEFAELPGRNAVWVDEPAQEQQGPGVEYDLDEADIPASTRPEITAVDAIPAKSSLEKLRQRQPEELSLIEMIERFAGALHERQEVERDRRHSADPSKDSTLAEALKTLSLFTENGFDASKLGNSDPEIASAELSRTERELRSALNKLQNLRGVA